MKLKVDVLARPECAPHAGEGHPHLLLRQAEAGSDLLAVDVQPLSVDEHVDAAAFFRQGQGAFGSERGVVLHARLVIALHPYVGLGVGIPVLDVNVTQHVAEVVELDRVRPQRLLHVNEDRQRLIGDAHRRRRAPRQLGVVGRHHRDRFALAAHDAGCERRLVRELEAVRELAAHVAHRQSRVHPRHGQRRRQVDRLDARVRVRAPHCGAPQHARRPQVAGVLERACHLRRSIDSG